MVFERVVGHDFEKIIYFFLLKSIHVGIRQFIKNKIQKGENMHLGWYICFIIHKTK